MINILIVDDSGSIRLQVKHMLKGTNCMVFEAANGKQVLLNMFSKDHSLEDMDLVLLDIHLGEVDGYEVLKNLTDRRPGLPVIMISSERKRENILKSVQAGAKDYILKPFTKELLISRISRFHDILIKEQIESNLKELDNALLIEVERAIRTNTAVSVLNLTFRLKKGMTENEIYRLKENLLKSMRKIDNIFIRNGQMTLVLPLTNKDGLNIVRQKIAKVFSETGMAYEDTYEKVFCFPDDLTEKALLQKFDSSKIKDIILFKIKTA